MGDQKIPSADMDQIHLPDPVFNDIRQLQADNRRLKMKLDELEKKINGEEVETNESI